MDEDIIELMEIYERLYELWKNKHTLSKNELPVLASTIFLYRKGLKIKGGGVL